MEFLNGGIIDKTDRDKIEIYLKETRYTYIETEWAKRYESNWRTYIKNIEKKLRNLKQSISTGITVNDIQLIIEYLIMYNFRSSEGNELFNEVFKDISNILPELDSIKIPEEERIHSEDDTALEEIKHNLLLNQFVEFLKSNKGYMKNFVDRCVRNLEINFCLTDSCYPFITSNTPAFILNRDDGAKEYILVALPTMLISLGRGNSQQFIVSNLSNKEVDVYNRKIAKHGTLLIVPDKDYDISTLLCI
ncbi:DUF4238 domain-containing protein [Clostridium butyricum]|nr:DUF4238 domain-containing protein [Clostridium butyricum]